MSEPQIGAGDMEIGLGADGEVKATLRPTLQACQAISRLSGGLNGAVQRCNVFDFDTICAVIAAGVGQNAKELPDLIYKAGIFNIAPLAIHFIHIVANGGRPIEDEGEGKEPDPQSGG